MEYKTKEWGMKTPKKIIRPLSLRLTIESEIQQIRIMIRRRTRANSLKNNRKNTNARVLQIVPVGKDKFPRYIKQCTIQGEKNKA